jgi:hypothetical protein
MSVSWFPLAVPETVAGAKTQAVTSSTYWRFELADAPNSKRLPDLYEHALDSREIDPTKPMSVDCVKHAQADRGGD